MNLEETWAELLKLATEDSGKPVGIWGGGLVIAKISSRGAPQLVVQCSRTGSAELEKIEAVGFSVTYQDLFVAQGNSPCVVLEPRASEEADMFNAVCEHLLEELKSVDVQETTNSVVDDIIRSWLAFWRTLKQNFSQSSFIGLVGELLTIDRWLRQDTFRAESWQGPSGGPHDFCGKSLDIEVKATTRRVGPLVHEISSIDQLQERPGRDLKLLSYRLGFSTTAAESVHDLVERVRSLGAFQASEAKIHLSNALENAGYSANLPTKYSRFDVWAQKLFSVDSEFPRLTRQGLGTDERVIDLRYSIDISGCRAEVTSNMEIDLEA